MLKPAFSQFGGSPKPNTHSSRTEKSCNITDIQAFIRKNHRLTKALLCAIIHLCTECFFYFLHIVLHLNSEKARNYMRLQPTLTIEVIETMLRGRSLPQLGLRYTLAIAWIKTTMVFRDILL